jgi:hypothetical protein
VKGGTGAVHRHRFKGKVNCDIDQVLLLHVTCGRGQVQHYLYLNSSMNVCVP